MLTFLEVNGIKIKTNNEEIIRIGLGFASGKIKYEQMLKWIKNNQNK